MNETLLLDFIGMRRLEALRRTESDSDPVTLPPSALARNAASGLKAGFRVDPVKPLDLRESTAPIRKAKKTPTSAGAAEIDSLRS